LVKFGFVLGTGITFNLNGPVYLMNYWHDRRLTFVVKAFPIALNTLSHCKTKIQFEFGIEIAE